jgi:valyl-tRNA synthetase
MALIFGAAPGSDISLSEDKIRGMRNFGNKLWNIARLFLMNMEIPQPNPQTDDDQTTSQKSNTHQPYLAIPFYDQSMYTSLSEPDQKIITDLNTLISDVTKDIEKYRFSDSAQKIYEFTWHRFADQYLEENKERFKEQNVTALAVFRHVLLHVLKLLHPFMPFITEEIWGKMPRKTHDPLIISSWPK